MATEAQIKITIDSQGAQRSIDTLQKDLVKSRLELDKMIKTFGVNSKEADNMRRSVAGLEIELTQLQKQTQGAVNSNQSLRAELRQITQELQKLEPGSQRFTQLSQRAGQLRDQIADTNAVINATSGNITENFGKALGNSLQLGVAGFQALSSAQVLFGSENENINRILAQMGALMNLSQAITTFGGLSDKLTEIKAGFTPLLTQLGILKVSQTETAVASTAAGVAMEGEAVASTEAAVATTAFGVSLNTLPLVAIITAIGLLVAGLISYFSTSNDAANGTENLTESQKKLQEQNKKNAEGTISEINGFKAYIAILSQTNNGSKERAAVIDEINSKYGTTLKNIQDEEAFQNQLNNAVINYIALQKARYDIAGKKNALESSFERENMALSFQKTYYQQLNKEKAKTQGYDQRIIDDLNHKIKGQQEIIDKEKEFQLQVGKETQAIIEREQQALKNLGITNNKNANSHKNNTNSKINDTQKYANELDKLNGKYERELAVLETQDKFRNQRISGTLEKEIETINKLYGDERQTIIDRAIQNEIDALDKKYEENTLKIEKGLTKDEQYTKERKKLQDDYDKYLLDSERNLLIDLEKYRQEDIKNVNNKFTLQEKIVKNQTEQILSGTRLIELEYQKKKEIEDINATETNEEKKNQKILEINKKYANTEIQLLKDLQLKKQTQLDLELQQTLTNEQKTVAEKEQAQAKYAEETIKLTQETADKINEINNGIKPPLPDSKKFETELKKTVEKISEYVEMVSGLYSQLSSVIDEQSNYQFSVRENNMNKLYEDEVVKLDESLRKQTISQEQYNADKERLDQELREKEKQLKKDQFETNKRLSIANAFMNGAQAVLQALGSAAPPINFILAALTTGLVGAQIAVIGNQQFQAATGGIVPGDGPRTIDSVSALLAPGEAVINAQSTSMFPELISSINEAGGGKKLTPNLPPRTASQTTPNVFSNGNQQNQVVKAYVVETDITDTQKRINRIKQSVEF